MSKKTALTIEEFRKLPRSVQNIRECELADHDRCLARLEDWEPSAAVLVEEPVLTAKLIQQRANFDIMVDAFIKENYSSANTDKTNKNDK